MIRPIAIASLLLLSGCGDREGKDGNEAASEGKSETTASAGSGVRMEPGQWEVKIESIRVEGVPAEMAGMFSTGEGKVDSQCITAAEIDQASAGLFAKEEIENCTQQGFAFQGGRVAGKLSCKDPSGQGGTMTMEMDGAYGARSYDMTQKMVTSLQGQTMTIHSRTTGRRVGDCPAGKEG